MEITGLMKSHPKTLKPEATIQSAARMMRDEDFDVIPVVNQLGSLEGIVTERDIVANAVANGLGPHTQVSECMTVHPETIARDATLDQAMMLMSSQQLPYLPVMENGRLVGMLTLTDIASNLYLDAEDEGMAEDEEPDFDRPPSHTYTLPG